MNQKSEKIKIISYNLKYNKANLELAGLAERYSADILCIQECYAEQLPGKISHMTLAERTKLGRLGMAIYYSADRFDVLKSSCFSLKQSVYDRIFNPVGERLLVTQLADKISGQHLFIGSFHATHLVASNYLRRTQIQAAHQQLKELCQESPAIMVGDYNYPLFKKGLRVCIEKTGYDMSLSDRPTYYMSKLIRAHFDLATSINTQIDRVMTLPKGLSDHTPILIHAVI